MFKVNNKDTRMMPMAFHFIYRDLNTLHFLTSCCVLMVIIFQNFNLWLQPASLRASLYRETDSKNTFSLKHILGLILTDMRSILLLKKLVLNVYYTFTAYREIIKKIACIY